MHKVITSILREHVLEVMLEYFYFNKSFFYTADVYYFSCSTQKVANLIILSIHFPRETKTSLLTVSTTFILFGYRMIVKSCHPSLSYLTICHRINFSSFKDIIVVPSSTVWLLIVLFICGSMFREQWLSSIDLALQGWNFPLQAVIFV